MHQCAFHHRTGTSTWTMASHCFVEPLWLFQCEILAPHTLSVHPEYQEYLQLLQWKKREGQGWRTGGLVWDGGGNVTVGSKKITGTTLRADLERSHKSMDIKHREWDVQALGTGPRPHKQSLAQGGDYVLTRRTGRHPKQKRFGKVYWCAWERGNGNASTLGSNANWASVSVPLREAKKGADPRALLPEFFVGRLCWSSVLVCEGPEHDLRFPSPSQIRCQGQRCKVYRRHIFFLLFWNNNKKYSKKK